MNSYDRHHNSQKKRLFDISISLLFLVFLVPIFLLIYPLLYLLLEKPVIFKQKRYGKNKLIFSIYKIRTMKKGAEQFKEKLEKINEAPYPMFKAKNDPRFLPLGKILSKFGLDELPQFINILKGEMSVVGPRPLPIKEADLLDQSWNFRYLVKPGIISFWALSTKRYDSLKAWKKLEKDTLRINSVITEIKLIIKAIYQILLKQMLDKCFNKK